MAQAGGFTPREVDDMELWECGAILGRHRPEPPEEAAPTPRGDFGGLPDPIKARVAAASARPNGAGPTLRPVADTEGR